MTRAGLWVIVCLALAPPPPAQQGPVFSSRVTNVRVDVLVTDAGATVRGLTPADFDVRDNGVLQQVELMAVEEVPLNIALALDLSGSVSGERLGHLRAAARSVVDALKPDDKVALLTFTGGVYVRTVLTADRDRVRRVLDEATSGGDTALVDAGFAAMALAESDTGRALAMLFSDGADTASFLTPSSVIATARRSEAIVYAASAGGPARSTFLRDLCDVTGGRLLSLTSTGGLGNAFLNILEEFRQRYLISFQPRGVSADGWHTLDVRVRNRRAEVKARPGYFAR